MNINLDLNLRKLSILSIAFIWSTSVILATFINLSEAYILGSIGILMALLTTAILMNTYDRFFRTSIKLPKIVNEKKEFKIILVYMILYFIIQWPVSIFLNNYSFHLISGLRNFVFDGYATIFKALITLIVPLVWIWRNNYLKEIGFTRNGLRKSIISIIPTSLLFFLFISPTLLIYEIKIQLILIAIIISFFRAGFPEELIFRPLFQERMERVFEEWSAILISSIIFALLHLPGLLILSLSRGGTNADLLTILSRLGLFHFTISLIFGYIWYKTRNLVGNVILHTLIDVLAIYQILLTA